jgi:hypothetical protein
LAKIVRQIREKEIAPHLETPIEGNGYSTSRSLREKAFKYFMQRAASFVAGEL